MAERDGEESWWKFGAHPPPPWRDIPELAGVPRARASAIYRRAFRRSFRSAAAWGATAAELVGVLPILAGVWFVLVVLIPVPAGAGLFGLVPGLVMFLVAGAAAYANNRLWRKFYRPTLRRCVRAELGTHCRDCDYDLRGLADPRGGGDARCPECGRPVTRDAHRPDAAGAAQK